MNYLQSLKLTRDICKYLLYLLIAITNSQSGERVIQGSIRQFVPLRNQNKLTPIDKIRFDS